jgi:hypothetical protein
VNENLPVDKSFNLSDFKTLDANVTYNPEPEIK